MRKETECRTSTTAREPVAAPMARRSGSRGGTGRTPVVLATTSETLMPPWSSIDLRLPVRGRAGPSVRR
ncbi:hypothetical protein, partial [Amycolatopsis lexingtonensis]|uniref:hypothetical protein n=1 Tax=Amycolatopsis lexingtonensis TaxID=218822 RepID=UPI001B80A44C